MQLAGHKQGFEQHESPEWILKRSSPNEERALRELMEDRLKPFVPQFRGLVDRKGHSYVEMQNLLHGFLRPDVMDVKIGLRTYLLEDVAASGPRMDLLEKMMALDPDEPTAEERKVGVTKRRYMEYRENLSSSASLGFRIEAASVQGVKPKVG